MGGQLTFIEVKTKKEIEALVNFDLEAFSALPEIQWSVKGLQTEINNGWTAIAVTYEEDTVAAVLMKEQGDILLTKTSTIKLAYQGNGFSHVIKDGLEEMAKTRGKKEIRHFCPKENFRQIALNERHGYQKVRQFTGENGLEVEEWSKKLS